MNEWIEITLRLGLATLAGVLLGANRWLHHKSAGVKTHALVSIGAALAMLIVMPVELHESDLTNISADAASRVLQGLLTGVGFLGAGVIIHNARGKRVQGLTTAASIWVTTMPAAGYRLAAVAGPVLDALCAKVQWPSDVSVRNRTFMQLCESSRTRAYFTLNRLHIGFQISMLNSAPGRAYLAWCPEAERTEILRRLSARPGYDNELLNQPKKLAHMLTQTREQGYALRDPNWGGGFDQSKSEYDDGLNAIALPILARRRVIGCVNIVWIARLFGPERMLKEHLPSLQSAASELGQMAMDNTHQAS